MNLATNFDYNQNTPYIPIKDVPPLIFKQMAAVLADVGHISKDQKNTTQNFKFRGIDDVYNALHVIFAKHKIFTTTEVLHCERTERTTNKGTQMTYTVLTVRFTFYAEDGSHVSSVVIGEANDSGDKGANKAMAIAHKYALLQAFCIPTEGDNDPDASALDTGEGFIDKVIEANDTDKEWVITKCKSYKLDYKVVPDVVKEIWVASIGMAQSQVIELIKSKVPRK